MDELAGSPRYATADGRNVGAARVRARLGLASAARRARSPDRANSRVSDTPRRSLRAERAGAVGPAPARGFQRAWRAPVRRPAGAARRGAARLGPRLSSVLRSGAREAQRVAVARQGGSVTVHADVEHGRRLVVV